MISVIIDCETGGVLPSHPTTQIAAIAIDGLGKAIDEIDVRLIFEESKCDPEALALNHYQAELWQKEAVTPTIAKSVLGAFFERNQAWDLISKKGRPYRTCRIIGHNVAFDIPRVRALWGKSFTPFAWWYPFDTLQLALWTIYQRPHVAPPRDYRLETLCKYFDVTAEGSAHDALADCRLTLGLFRALLRLTIS